MDIALLKGSLGGLNSRPGPSIPPFMMTQASLGGEYQAKQWATKKPIGDMWGRRRSWLSSLMVSNYLNNIGQHGFIFSQFSGWKLKKHIWVATHQIRCFWWMWCSSLVSYFSAWHFCGVDHLPRSLKQTNRRRQEAIFRWELLIATRNPVFTHQLRLIVYIILSFTRFTLHPRWLCGISSVNCTKVCFPRHNMGGSWWLKGKSPVYLAPSKNNQNDSLADFPSFKNMTSFQKKWLKNL